MVLDVRPEGGYNFLVKSFHLPIILGMIHRSKRVLKLSMQPTSKKNLDIYYLPSLDTKSTGGPWVTTQWVTKFSATLKATVSEKFSLD